MNALLPIIEQLADAPDDPARARWLLACPLSVLMKYQDTIRNRLRCAFFQEGVDYLESELALCRQVRKSGLPNKDNPLRVGMLGIAGFRAFEATEI
jgi:hypothetical protein